LKKLTAEGGRRKGVLQDERFFIRPATASDAGGLAALVTALGYPTVPSQMAARLGSILSDDDYSTLIAEEGGAAVGFVGVRRGVAYEADEPYAQIMALAVAETHRRHGIASALMRAAETMLEKSGIGLAVITTGNQRSDAHRFYEANGYTFTGRRYVKRFGV
jgi:ribosomal protein S18 acetylase RimI-like enzyme